MKGCVFHWTQAVWRHVQQCGLAPAYREHQSLYHYVRQLLALPFLPANQIRETFDLLKERSNSQALDTLTGYIERQWMSDPVFEIASWSVFEQTVRTNNDVEGK